MNTTGMTSPALTSNANYSIDNPPQAAQQAYPARDRIRNINIREIDHGYMVEVGCQSLAIESKTKLIALLTEYLHNPVKTEDKYMSGNLV